MGEHCELMAKEWGITREAQDLLAYESHKKAAAAYDEGFMDDAARYPLFQQEELVRERPVVTGEFDRNEANPFFHLQRGIDTILWTPAYYSRKNVIGKPFLFKTTKEFLIQFGLKDLSELPTLKEFEEIRRMAFAEAPAESAPAGR